MDCTSNYLLLAWVKTELKSPQNIADVAKVVRASLLNMTDLRILLEAPASLSQKHNADDHELSFDTQLKTYRISSNFK